MIRYQEIINIFKKVRDIPYGDIGSRDPDDILENNMGTCSGKHSLLKKLYENAGIECKNFVALHKFIDLPIKYPSNLMDILNKSDIIDPHNFIKIKIDNKWITVDATWDKTLKKYGFPVTENWNGKSSMNLCVIPLDIEEVADPIKYKEQKLSLLPKKIQEDRKLFLKSLSIWLNKIR
jgi:hypothetical protein